MDELDLNFLPGVYELVRVITDEGGTWVDQRARGGIMTLSANGICSVISSPYGDSCMPYLGKYEVKDRLMEITVSISNIPGLETSTLVRGLLFLDSECLILESIRAGVRSRLTWKKIACLHPV